MDEQTESLNNQSDDSATVQTVKGESLVFSFGDPESVLSKNLIEYLGVFADNNGEYYTPPVSLKGLANAKSANGYHESILHFKKNMILRWLNPSDALTYSTAQKMALDWVVLGNMNAQIIKNRFGNVLRLKALPAMAMRKALDQGKYVKLKPGGELVRFKKDEVIHIKEPDIKQDIYGLPEYLGGLQAALLSEDATLFRRRFYVNGAHMGYILVTSNAGIDDKTATAIENQIKKGKGAGNGRSLYINIPKTIAKEPVQVIPIGELGTKDDFEKIQNATMREMIAMHRMQPGLAGLIPENTAGFGDLKKIMEVYYELEVLPLQQAFLEINEHLPRAKQISFKEPTWLKENTV